MDRSVGIIGFEYWSELRDVNGKLLSRRTAHNLYTIEGLNYVLDSSIGVASKIPTFYMGIFEAAYAPAITDTAASLPAAATECTAYQGTTRPIFQPNIANGGVLNNVGHEATFTLTANKTIYGGFIASGQAKGSVTGKLISVAAFGTPQAGVTGNVLTLGGGCTLING